MFFYQACGEPNMEFLQETTHSAFALGSKYIAKITIINESLIFNIF